MVHRSELFDMPRVPHSDLDIHLYVSWIASLWVRTGVRTASSIHVPNQIIKVIDSIRLQCNYGGTVVDTCFGSQEFYTYLDRKSVV